MRKNITERRFMCPSCGYVATAYKKSSRRTAYAHNKKLWCPFCKDEHNFAQLSKWD